MGGLNSGLERTRPGSTCATFPAAAARFHRLWWRGRPKTEADEESLKKRQRSVLKLRADVVPAAVSDFGAPRRRDTSPRTSASRSLSPNERSSQRCPRVASDRSPRSAAPWAVGSIPVINR